jgi:major vault protein
MASSSDDERVKFRNQDMILTGGEYVHITDKTKGEVNVYIGPNKQSLGGDDLPVIFDQKSNRFKSVTLEQAIQAFSTAVEGSYIVLENPADGDKRPTTAGKQSPPTLRIGKRLNIAGPASFALWPGQSAKVVPGHNLRSNEYLLCRVYDEEAAKKNASEAVIKTNDGAATKTGSIPSTNDLTMGKLFIVQGTEVSFYIPPTGIEVVPEMVGGEERYGREAVTLECLEYCLLLDQNGNKRYIRGPAVVFPKPTEKFVEAPIKSNPQNAKAKKFRAQELVVHSGIHIRVITDYIEPDGTERHAGDELFVTGKEQPVYFPREEHAIIKYGDQDVHHGLAIPSGEARYVLNRDTGVIDLIKGPCIFLADPRTQVIAQRALSPLLCSLLYPDNPEALEINLTRLGADPQDITGVGGANAIFLNNSYTRSGEDENYGAVAAVASPDTGTGRKVLIRSASKSLPGDEFQRKAKFTAPRTVILNTKYDGAVTTTIWQGYAMLLISKSGERRIVQGPGTYMMEYDESPQIITLSTGKPKNLDNPFKTVFLQTSANMVSDIIEVETKDFCRLNVKVSYRVNFEGGNAEQWFAVDNYVKFLCDHMRSKVRNAVQKFGIQEFYGNHTEILRDVILGKVVADKPGSRPGTTFSENGMRIYDVEVLGVAMQNTDVEKLLVQGQRESLTNALKLAAEHRQFSYLKEVEVIKRALQQQSDETENLAFQLKSNSAQRKLDYDTLLLMNAATEEAQRMANEKAASETRFAIDLATSKAAAEIATVNRETLIEDQEKELEKRRRELEMELQKIEAQTTAVTLKAGAIGPDLIAALQAFGDKDLLGKVAESMAPMALLTGGKKSVVEAFGELIKGTDVAKHLETLSDSRKPR